MMLSVEKSPIYVATLFEVSLRISSPFLLHAFGNRFIQFLELIRSRVIPKLIEGTPRLDVLREFLNRYIASNGKDHMSFFKS